MRTSRLSSGTHAPTGGTVGELFELNPIVGMLGAKKANPALECLDQYVYSMQFSGVRFGELLRGK